MSSEVFKKLLIVELVLALLDPIVHLLDLLGREPLVVVLDEGPELALLQVAVVLVVVEVEDLGHTQLVLHYYVLYSQEQRFLGA
jgi:hypothetical protein